MNELFKNALNRTPQKTPPIWFMRQAGRYHQHYQALRAKHSFMELCKQPELAAQVALGPVEEFDFDVSILFSDILFPLEALGMGLDYTDHGPQLGYRLSHETIGNLGDVNKAIEFMHFQKDAVIATRQVLPSNKSLIGFVGGLWTLFVYATEGSHAGSLIQSKKNIHLFPKFLEKMYPLIKENIRLQLEGGVEVVMIFDTAAGEVSPMFFQEWIQPVLTSLAKEYPGKIGYYSKGTQAVFFNKAFTELPWAGQGFDHRCYIPECFKIQNKGFVQGNFDQGLLFMDDADFKKALNNFLAPMKDMSIEQRAGWVCGLGHGVLPKTPEKNVKLFVETVREVLS
ncbi:uroporphyrinogen decarboxylase family protein [Bdellovibrio svalbardensis]|uniref:Uroporphyrinogen decarboxylase n=1 Tax=Bdellovibrio svalbardensis TaxID=2972972 RepID=A0ABT6DEP7_9BACT|nr:uroporphyrinogen decarboxylase family protein [Bdellovibrio svalbardensis]MDG0815305.1 uroporphyrinogen decarboxylase [Bdellovibrio svalbardensis]